MKGSFTVLGSIVLLLFLLASQLAYAQSNPPAKALSPKEVKQLREGVATLGKAFGITADADSSRHVGQEGTEKPKTFAGVADKGLDMVKSLVVSLSETLEKVAPQVWRVMVRQQYAKAISVIVVPWGLLLLTLLYVALAKRLWTYNKEEPIFGGAQQDQDPTNRGWRGICTTVIPMVLGFIFAIWGVVALKDASLYLINPEYYAIRDLLLMIMNPGAIAQ